MYVNSTTKVDLICHKEGHGLFKMLPLNRLKGQQCPSCAQETRIRKTRKTQEQFIKECYEHPKADTLIFTGTVYNGDKGRVTIECKEHGPFDIIASNFLQQTNVCPGCAEGKSGYRHSLPGYVYVLGTERSTIIKVGITNRTPEIRAKEVSRSSGKKFTVYGSIFSENGMVARETELKAHAWLAENGQPVEEVFDGSTECFAGITYTRLLGHLLGIQIQTTETV